MSQQQCVEQKCAMPPDVLKSEYDFSRCKLCGTYAASPKYKLKKTTVYACASCDFHFINHLDSIPVESGEEDIKPLDRKAWDYIESMLPANEQQLRKNLQVVKQHLPLAGARCLDIGAGAGLFSRLLSETGATVQGIEPQGVFREFARQKFNISLIGNTIDAPHWQEKHADYFDAVTLWDVFEHVNFPAETLQSAFNVIKTGGWLFLDTPRRDAIFYRISEWSYGLSGGANPLFLESLYSPLPFRHKQLFTLRQLLDLVKKTGFTVTKIRSSLLLPNNKIVLVCRKP